ncbi:hypothetical protein AGMMS49982_09350 [Bacteroidia bacterium]|nr:hypothetical protein AGMMS49982_09350 [Bacteroidia bacterium]
MRNNKLTIRLINYFIDFMKELLKPIVIVTGIGVYFALDNYITNNDREKKKATIEYFNGFYDILETTDTNLLDTINFYGHKGRDYILDTYILENILNNNPTYKIQLDKLLNFLNLYAISCQEGIFEEETAWAAYYRVIAQATKALIPYYEIIEKERGRKVVGWFLRNMAVRWNIDPSYRDKFNKKSDRLEHETEKMIERYSIEDKKVIISR